MLMESARSGGLDGRNHRCIEVAGWPTSRGFNEGRKPSLCTSSLHRLAKYFHLFRLSQFNAGLKFYHCIASCYTRMEGWRHHHLLWLFLHLLTLLHLLRKRCHPLDPQARYPWFSLHSSLTLLLQFRYQTLPSSSPS